MKKVIYIVMLMGMMVFHGHEAKSYGFGFGGRGGRGATDMGNLMLAGQMGTFTPPADPFQHTRGPSGQHGGGYGYGAPAPPIPNQMAAPQISASSLMNPSMGGLANLGRTMSSSQLRVPAAPVQSQSYALPSDMGLHSLSGFSAPPQ